MRGASERVDSLVDVLSGIENEAISKKTVFFSQITEALGSIRRLDFKPHRNINYTLASLEYFSTKAFLRYVSGMHFGFINPGKFMNRLEMEEPGRLAVREIPHALRIYLRKNATGSISTACWLVQQAVSLPAK